MQLFQKTGALLLVSVLCGTFSQAALPPQPPAQRLANAQAVALVKINSVQSRGVKTSIGTNTQYVANAIVERVVKGNLKVRQRVTFQYWVAKTRPNGWAGPSGQYNLPQVGERGTFFARRVGTSWDLLQPNGWEPLKTKN